MRSATASRSRTDCTAVALPGMLFHDAEECFRIPRRFPEGHRSWVTDEEAGKALDQRRHGILEETQIFQDDQRIHLSTCRFRESGADFSKHFRGRLFFAGNPSL